MSMLLNASSNWFCMGVSDCAYVPYAALLLLLLVGNGGNDDAVVGV